MILSRYERMIARRYLLPGKGEGFIFLVASISLFAVMLGVAALIIVMSVMNGFRDELFSKVVGLNGHAVVQGYGNRLSNWEEIVEAAKDTPGVTAAVPLIETSPEPRSVEPLTVLIFVAETSAAGRLRRQPDKPYQSSRANDAFRHGPANRRL